jgi:hypothetical protein
MTSGAVWLHFEPENVVGDSGPSFGGERERQEARIKFRSNPNKTKRVFTLVGPNFFP